MNKNAGGVVGRLGEYIAYKFLWNYGPVTFGEFDFEVAGRPVEVKTTVEHLYTKQPHRNYPPGTFVINSLEKHRKLCEQNGLYCFVLLRDDGFASVKLKEAHEVTVRGRNEVKYIRWASIFKYKTVKNNSGATTLKVCTEPPFLEWRPLVSSDILRKMTHRR